MRMPDYWRKRRELEKAWARAVHECGGSSFCARVWLVACNKLEARRRGDGLQGLLDAATGQTEGGEQ